MLSIDTNSQVKSLFTNIDKNSEFEVIFNNYKTDNKLPITQFMNLVYYVKHTADSFKFSGGVSEAFQQQQLEKEKQLIQDKGAVPYYIEKYGKWVLFAVVGVAIFRGYLKYKK